MALVIKNPSANVGDIKDAGSIFESGRSLEEGMAIHSSIFAWGNPMDREAWQAIQSMGSQRVGHH